MFLATVALSLDLSLVPLYFWPLREYTSLHDIAHLPPHIFQAFVTQARIALNGRLGQRCSSPTTFQPPARDDVR